jgi:FK506-binding protein 14
LLASMATLALAEPEVRPSGLKIINISFPKTCERKFVLNDLVSMDYTVTLDLEGTKIQIISFDRNFIFRIREGQIIKAFEEGVLGMCVGEKRRLLVPSELVPEIMNKIKLVNDDGEIISGGAGATLFFDIELLLELL